MKGCYFVIPLYKTNLLMNENKNNINNSLRFDEEVVLTHNTSIWDKSNDISNENNVYIRICNSRRTTNFNVSWYPLSTTSEHYFGTFNI